MGGGVAFNVIEATRRMNSLYKKVKENPRQGLGRETLERNGGVKVDLS